MNLLIDGKTLWRNTSGTERYITELVNGLNQINNVDVSLLSSPNARYHVDYPRKSKSSSVLDADVFHKPYPVQNSIELAEMASAKKSVLTVLDLILLHYPEILADDKKLYQYRDNLELSLSLADRVIAISEHGKQDIIDNFKINPSKIDVSYLGASNSLFTGLSENDRSQFRKKIGLPENYILCVNSDFPHKNMKNMLKGFIEAKRRGELRDYYLVWAGNSFYRSKDKELESLKAELGASLIMLKYVSDRDLPRLYFSSKLFAYPSLYEGFGLPVLEAFAAGVPVLCSNATSIPEVAGDSAYLVDASIPFAISEGLIKITSDKSISDELVKRGKSQLQKFSWNKCCAEHYDIYNKASFPESDIVKTVKHACINLLSEIDPPNKTKFRQFLIRYIFPLGGLRYRLVRKLLKGNFWKK